MTIPAIIEAFSYKEPPLRILTASTLLVLSLCPIPAAAQLASHERVAANENRVAAGTLKNGVLDLMLEIRNGMWYPEADNGASVPIQAVRLEVKTRVADWNVPVDVFVRAAKQAAIVS